MLQLKYSENPNGKLFMDVWGDIRLADYSKFAPGQVLEICLRKHEMGIAEVIGYKEFTLKRLNDTTSHMNSGLPVYKQTGKLKFYYQNTGKLDDDTIMMHVVLKWKQRNMAVQAELMADWWRSKEEQFPYVTTKETQYI